MIKVQPTSIARSAKVAKGSKWLLAGRPPLGEKTTVKKNRNLGLNINLTKQMLKAMDLFKVLILNIYTFYTFNILVCIFFYRQKTWIFNSYFIIFFFQLLKG
jgi:hypothetical protein